MNRTFDEPIDESTLVTDSCIVSDGTSHGGTEGATIATPSELGAINYMTIWSDPNYGPPSEDGSMGLFTPRPLSLTSLNPYVGTLNFIGNNVTLNVGDLVEHTNGEWYYTTNSALSVMPYFYFNFFGSGQSVVVQPNSWFDYWGLNATHTSLGVQNGIRTPFTDGTADGYGAGTIDIEGDDPLAMPGKLTVHGGADFFIGGGGGAYPAPTGGTLISNNGTIDVLHENSIYPISSTLSQATGHMTLDGKTTLTNGIVTGNASPAYQSAPYEDNIITVGTGYWSYGYATPTSAQFYASYTDFQN